MISIRLRSIAWFVAGGVVAAAVTLMFVQAWRVDAAPGDTDTTLVPITPCRLVDTRAPGGAPLNVGEIRTIEAHGTHGPEPGSQCTIPTDAVALSMNVTAVNASAPTFWTIWPDGVVQPTASSLNPAPGQPPTPNAVTTPISSSGRFKVFNAAGVVDMVIDVNGYHTKASLTELAAAVAALEADVARLDVREPITATNRDEFETVTATPEVVASVTIPAPAAGHVTVLTTTRARTPVANVSAACSIDDGIRVLPALDEDYLQVWESAGSDGEQTQLTATRTFEVAANVTATYRLVCAGSGGSVDLLDTVVTAIFTPLP